MKAFVYLLVCDDMFKIGKATDIGNRYQQLKSNYSFDLQSSYSIETINEAEAYKLEKTLHFIFDDHRVSKLPRNDGSTEFFNLSCLNDVLSVVSHINEHKNLKLSKNIKLRPKPPKPTKHRALDPEEMEKMVKKEYPYFLTIKHSIRYLYFALKNATETNESIEKKYFKGEDSKEKYYIHGHSILLYKNVGKKIACFVDYRISHRRIGDDYESMRRRMGIYSPFNLISKETDGDSKRSITISIRFDPEPYVKYFRKNKPKTAKERFVASYIEKFKDIDVDIDEWGEF